VIFPPFFIELRLCLCLADETMKRKLQREKALSCVIHCLTLSIQFINEVKQWMTQESAFSR